MCYHQGCEFNTPEPKKPWNMHALVLSKTEKYALQNKFFF